MRIVLGTRDSEARVIEDIVIEITQDVQLKWTSGDPYSVPASDLRPGDVCVECGSPEVQSLRIDHHYPGDTGYDVGASQAFGGSSAGQVLHLLMNTVECRMPLWDQVTRVSAPGLYKIDGRWCAAPADCVARAVPLRYVRVGEADHALAAFIAGGCTTSRQQAIDHYMNGRSMPDVKGIASRIMAGDQVLPGVYDIRWLPWFRRIDTMDLYTVGLLAGVGIVSWGASEAPAGARHVKAACTGDGSVPGVMDVVGLLLDMGCSGVYGSNIRGYAGGVR